MGAGSKSGGGADDDGVQLQVQRHLATVGCSWFGVSGAASFVLIGGMKLRTVLSSTMKSMSYIC